MPRTENKEIRRKWSVELDREVEKFLSRCPINRERVNIEAKYDSDSGEYTYAVFIDGKTIYKSKANEKTLFITEDVMQRDGKLRTMSTNYDHIRMDSYKRYYQVDEHGKIIIGRNGVPVRKKGEVYIQDKRGNITQTDDALEYIPAAHDRHTITLTESLVIDNFLKVNYSDDQRVKLEQGALVGGVETSIGSALANYEKHMGLVPMPISAYSSLRDERGRLIGKIKNNIPDEIVNEHTSMVEWLNKKLYELVSNTEQPPQEPALLARMIKAREIERVEIYKVGKGSKLPPIMFSSEWLESPRNISALRKMVPDVTARESLVKSVNPEFMKNNRRAISTLGERVNRWWKGVIDSISSVFSSILRPKKDAVLSKSQSRVDDEVSAGSSFISTSLRGRYEEYTRDSLDGERSSMDMTVSNTVTFRSEPLEAIAEGAELTSSPSVLKVTANDGEDGKSTPTPSPSSSNSRAPSRR